MLQAPQTCAPCLPNVFTLKMLRQSRDTHRLEVLSLSLVERARYLSGRALHDLYLLRVVIERRCSVHVSLCGLGYWAVILCAVYFTLQLALLLSLVLGPLVSDMLSLVLAFSSERLSFVSRSMLTLNFLISASSRTFLEPFWAVIFSALLFRLSLEAWSPERKLLEARVESLPTLLAREDLLERRLSRPSGTSFTVKTLFSLARPSIFCEICESLSSSSYMKFLSSMNFWCVWLKRKV